MTNLIRWKIDHPEHPMIYETEAWRLEGDIQAIKWENNLLHADIIIINEPVPTNPDSDHSISCHQESTPVSKPTRKRKPRSKAS